MDPIHKKVLANKTSEIMKRISNPVVLCAYFKTIFSIGDVEEIKAKTSHHGATTGTQTMLSLLEKRGPKAFPLFIRALLDPAISCADLADDLEQEERKLRGKAGPLIWFKIEPDDIYTWAMTREANSAPVSPRQRDNDSVGTLNSELKRVTLDPELKRQLQFDGCFLHPEKYDPVKFLGSGGFAKVYLVIQRRTGRKMACKMFFLEDTQEEVVYLKRQVSALSYLKHEHIVEFLAVEQMHNTGLLFLEYMEGRTLHDLLEINGPLEEPLLVKFTRQLLSAVDFLHTHNVIHGDIRGVNVLLDGPQENIKLADFGISTIMKDLKATTRVWHLPGLHYALWESPELITGKAYGRNTDIWSVGCTVVEMLTIKPPSFSENISPMDMLIGIANYEVEPPADCTSLAYGFLKRCLCRQENRASAAELLGDPFLNHERQEEVHPQGVPSEIVARGILASKAYNRALLEGKTYVRRVPVMIIGQDRTGKTSLKKSLKGETFNPNEKSTVGIETDPSYFKVSTDVWRTGVKSKGTKLEQTFSFEHQAAQMIFDSLRNRSTDYSEAKELTEKPNTSGSESQIDLMNVAERCKEPSGSRTESSLQESKVFGKAKANSSVLELSEEPNTSRIKPAFQDPKVLEKPKANSATIDGSQKSSTSGIEPSLQDSKDHLVVPNLPEDVASLVQKLLENNKEAEDQNDIYSILWDFGGQSVYYATHPIFLTEKAIYILVSDLSRDPHQKGSVPMKKGMSRNIKNTSCSKTNLDNLDFWMSSVYSLVSPDAVSQKDLRSEKLPPVFLVCTHADTPYSSEDPEVLARETYGSLKDKIYGKLLKGFFVVDNTKSGSADECQGVKKLREKVHFVAKNLPQMNEAIPLKWLKYEKVLRLLSEEGYKWIPIEKARHIALDECGINDDDQFQTLLNFLHDQRVLIHFNESQELRNMVILSPQWLIDMFKEVITVRSWELVEESVEDLWRNLEKNGILDEKLLDSAWRHLFVNQETCKSLVAIMERFSLLCPWPSDCTTKQYLVPSMLKSPPTADVLELLASVRIPSLFVRFESCRVPPGLFSRLILLFHHWAQDKWGRPVKPKLFNNFALFHIRPHDATSVTLLCHSSSIEIVLHVMGVALDEVSDLKLGYVSDLDASRLSRDIHRQLRLLLECMRKEFSWLKHMKYETCVSCPVCSQRGGSKCRDHGVRGCDCLHLLSELDLQDYPYCDRHVVCADCRIHKEMFVHWFAFSDVQESRVTLTQRVDVTGRNHSGKNFAVSTREQSLVLPGGVLKAIRSRSCDAADVVAQMQESVENLQLKSAVLVDLAPETKQWIRCLAINAKNENRMDIVTYLRSIAPAGTTGPLLAENLDVRCIPFKQRKALTFNLCGGDEWKLLAEKLGMSYDEIRVLDKRTLNPCDVALNLVANSRHLNVGEVYDILVECELPGSADLL